MVPELVVFSNSQQGPDLGPFIKNQIRKKILKTHPQESNIRQFYKPKKKFTPI